MDKKTELRIQRTLRSLDGYQDIVHAALIERGGPGTVHISCDYTSVLGFKFRKQDYWYGNPIDSDDETDRAVVSLRSEQDAIRFVAAYMYLVDLRAKRKEPE